MKYYKLLSFIFFLLLLSLPAAAQQKNTYPGFNDEINQRIDADSTSKLFVSAIIINGNKKTKSYIILREMPCKTGDSILASNLFNTLQESRALVYNTSLFSEVTVSPVLVSARELIIKVTVLEKLYIYPTPQFKLVDRNLNEWIKTYNANLNRVIYGVKFAHYNLSGRGDKLRIYVLSGYARALTFSYSAPYSNGALTEGFSVSGGYTQSREFAYKSSGDNKLLQFKNIGFVRNNFTLGASYQRRKGYFKKTVFAINYSYIKVSDSAILPQYNPNYLNSSKSYVGFVDLQYGFQYSKTNNNNYPLKGTIINAGITKRGFGISGGVNMLSLDASHASFIPHQRNWYSSAEVLGNIKLPFKQAYINQSQMGYREFYLRGLEYYVIDGVAAAIAKYTLKKKLIAFNIPFPFNIKKIPRIPFTIYAKSYADMGFSYNKEQFNTKLGNKLLYTTGFGLDVVSLYDTTLRLEYSFNQLGENGLFLHAKSLF